MCSGKCYRAQSQLVLLWKLLRVNVHALSGVQAHGIITGGLLLNK